MSSLREWGGRLALAAALVVVAGFGLAACGSSGGSSTDSGSSGSASSETEATAKVEFSGEPITVATAVPASNTPSGTFPGVFTAVEAAAAAINAEGGIQGHEVKVLTCDTQADPNLEASCAREAVSAHAVAMVGSFIVQNAPGYESTLAKGDVPDLAASALTPQEYEGDNTFPIDFAAGTLVACASKQLAAEAGTDTVTLTAENEVAAKDQFAIVEAAAPAQGLKAVGPQIISQNTADFSPVVQKYKDEGAGIVIFADSAPVELGILQADASVAGGTTFCTPNSALQPEQLAKLGSAAEKYHLASTLPPITAADEYPILQTFIEQMEASGESGASAVSADDFQVQTLRAWLGMQVLDQVAGKIKGQITGTSLREALSKSEVDLGNILPVIDFRKPTAIGPYHRVFTDQALLEKWDPGSEQFETTGIKLNVGEIIGGPPSGKEGPPPSGQ